MYNRRNARHTGFTLLEVMLAVCVLAVVSVSVYRFVETALIAVHSSTESARERALVTAFAGYLRGEMQALPGARAGAITGEPHRFDAISSDELRWIAQPGSGLLTRHAEDEWAVTLTAKQLENGEYELGMRRQDMERRRNAEWLPLFRRVRGFEVRYFDRGRAQWLEKWTDPQTRPALVRVKLWRDPAADAYEVVLPVSTKTGGAG
ncbi:MAG: prepilin-type N-terminal cleavage/methylation domain-containing protein [Chthoniobacteraceae bacterium]|nr:prepilin-type N-terminal cleavage/methylation domain-containing protein [Chthoniobacteraceae bacterium]